MPAERGMAALVTFACTLQDSPQDDVLDVLDRLLTDLLARLDRQEQSRRLRTIGHLDIAALLLRGLSLLALDQSKLDGSVRQPVVAHLAAGADRAGSRDGRRTGSTT